MCKRSFAVSSILLWFILLLPILARAQSTTSTNPVIGKQEEEKGYELYETFGGSFNGQGDVLSLDTQTGYRFNPHFGLMAGIPVYFVRDSSSVTGSGSSSTNNGIGDFYLGPEFWASNDVVNYASSVIVTAPTGDTSRGLSTGRATVDWNNHFDHQFDRLRPFGEAGIGNTIPNIGFARPFTTLGFVSHLEGGASYKLNDIFSVGASAYGILPAGQQKVFSKLFRKGAGGKAFSHGRVFDLASETTGPASLTREGGFSTWVGASPTRLVDMELGYTRSVTYDLNTVYFEVGLDVARMIRNRSSH